MSFDVLARFYRGMEAVLAGGILQRGRTAFLEEAKGCRRALLLGEGPGRFLEALLEAYPEMEIVCVEQSVRMIQEARRQLGRQGLELCRVQFELGDARTWQASRGKFDLVVTHFFLDCFEREEMERIVARVAGFASADACWLLADFRLPEQGWRRWRARVVSWMMIRFFRHVAGISASQLPCPEGALRRAGFLLERRRRSNGDFVCSDLWRRGRLASEAKTTGRGEQATLDPWTNIGNEEQETADVD